MLLAYGLTIAAADAPSTIPQNFGIPHSMPPYKQPSFQERAALAAKAKADALEKLRAKPPVDEAVLAARREAALAKEAAQAAARAEKLAAREQKKAERQALAEQKKAAAAVVEPVKTEAEQKALRDAKYAARKNRLGKK